MLLIGNPTISRAAPPDEPTPTCDPSQGECPQPSEPATAVEWYARGIELASTGEYAAAAEAFLRSYNLQATPEALFNAAFAYEKAGATITAIETYERFLAEPSPTQEYIEPARHSIQTLTRTLGVLKGVRYNAERPPVQLFVQGEQVELDAFPLLVKPGNIEIEVVDEQGHHVREAYELLAGEALVIDLRALMPVPAIEQPVEQPPDVDPSAGARIEAAQAHARRAAALRKVTWVGVALTGSSAVAAVTFGLLALHEKRLYDAQTCQQFENMNCPPDWPIGDPQRHFDLYHSRAITGTVLASVSGALALGTLVVGLVSIRHERASRLTDRGHGRARVQLRPGLGTLMLRF